MDGATGGPASGCKRFRTERFRDLHHLAAPAAAFEAFHNTHHRYSALKGATPEEWEFINRYVTATLHVRTQRLVIDCAGRRIGTEFPLAP